MWDLRRGDGRAQDAGEGGAEVAAADEAVAIGVIRLEDEGGLGGEILRWRGGREAGIGAAKGGRDRSGQSEMLETFGVILSA